MTNFEKWKAELNPNNVTDYFFYTDTCSSCPAYSYCRKHRSDNDLCVETFKAWANLEVTE